MALSQKCLYALRACLELARRHDLGPAKVGEIAEAQQIPLRFLEVILSELRQGGITESRRGKEGGYVLRRHPRELTVGEVIRFVEGPLHPVDSTAAPPPSDVVFAPIWVRVEDALRAIYDGTTFQQLLDEDARLRAMADFHI